MKTITDLEFDRLTSGAEDSPRQYTHLNIHTELNELVRYRSMGDKDFAIWIPKQNTAQLAEYLMWFGRAQMGESAPLLKQ